jgi:hypothetical protein
MFVSAISYILCQSFHILCQLFHILCQSFHILCELFYVCMNYFIFYVIYFIFYMNYFMFVWSIETVVKWLTQLQNVLSSHLLSILILSFSLLFLSTRCKLENLQAMLMFPAEAYCMHRAWSCLRLMCVAVSSGSNRTEICFATRVIREPTTHAGGESTTCCTRAWRDSGSTVSGGGGSKGMSASEVGARALGSGRVGGRGLVSSIGRRRRRVRIGIGWLFNHPTGRLDFRSSDEPWFITQNVMNNITIYIYTLNTSSPRVSLSLASRQTALPTASVCGRAFARKWNPRSRVRHTLKKQQISWNRTRDLKLLHSLVLLFSARAVLSNATVDRSSRHATMMSSSSYYS